jgi:uncharacterized membrane protein YfcA
MERKERTVISAVTLLTSLAFYWYARAHEKHEVPFVLVGAFVGSLIGEKIADRIKKDENGSSADH